jgi:hypothetical protein
MNKAIAMILTVTAFVLGACGGEDPPKEETASTTSHLWGTQALPANTHCVNGACTCTAGRFNGWSCDLRPTVATYNSCFTLCEEMAAFQATQQ